MDSPTVRQANAANRDPESFWFIAAVCLLLTVSAALRFRGLADSLFEDEVWVARLLKSGDLRPHTYAIPVGFYLLGRLWAAIAGYSDFALRIPAAVFGVLLCAVPFAAPLPRLTRYFWAALLAFSSPFLYYSARLKQYTVEATLDTLLIVLFLRASESCSRRDWTYFFLTASVAVFLFHSPVFIVAAAGLAALVSRKTRSRTVIVAFIGVGVLAIAAYATYMSPGLETARIHGDMEEWFSRTGRWVASPRDLLSNTLHWTGHALNLARGGLVVTFVLVCNWLNHERRLSILILAVAPPSVAILLSMLHLYPYGEVRLMLFCFPGLYLLIAVAMGHLSRQPIVPVVALAVFSFQGIARAPYDTTYMRTPDLKDVYAMIATDRAREPIVATPSFATPLLYYYPELGTRTEIRTISSPDRPGWYLQLASDLKKRGSFTLEREGVIATRVP